jgi:hypothetical protein
MIWPLRHILNTTVHFWRDDRDSYERKNLKSVSDFFSCRPSGHSKKLNYHKRLKQEKNTFIKLLPNLQVTGVRL